MRKGKKESLKMKAIEKKKGTKVINNSISLKTVFQTSFSKSAIFSSSWDPSGKFLAFGFESGELSTFSLQKKNKKILFASTDDEPITSLAWSLSGDLIAFSTGESLRIFFVEVQTGKVSELQDPSHEIKHFEQINDLAWSKCGKYLASCSDDGQIIVWDIEKMLPQKNLEGHTDFVNALLWANDSNQLLSASSDETISLWSVEKGEIVRSLEGHDDIVLSLAYSSKLDLLASGSGDKTIMLWDISNGRLIATLEGHTRAISSLSFSSDGNYLASISTSGHLKIWDCRSWDIIVSNHEKRQNNFDQTGDRLCYQIHFSPADNSLVCIGEFGKKVSIIEIKAGKGKLARPRTDLINYINAKVVLVGESGVGKTGLGMRLKEKCFIPSPGSTHGAQFWQFELPKSLKAEIGLKNIKAEVTLWDLAGQPEYRLIHQLFLDDVDLALLLFDCSDPQEPFRGVSYWAKILSKHSRNHTVKFLVSSRCDVSPPTVDNLETVNLLHKHGIQKYFRTSAQTGDGILELREEIFRSINWKFLPKTSTPKLFHIIRELFLKEKEIGSKLVPYSSIQAEVKRKYGQKQIQGEEIETVVGLLQARGLVYKLNPAPNVELVLLRPELVNQYASSIIHAARNSLGSIGAINERDVVIGQFQISGFQRAIPQDEKAILESTVEILIKNDICFRELGLLIFPSQVNMSRPSGAYKKPLPDVTYKFFGNIDSIYASLVVRLCYTEYFQREEQWRYAAEFSREGSRLGFQMKHSIEDRGELGIYFFPDVSEFDRVTFIRFITDHLKVKGIEIEEEITLVCQGCGKEILNREAVESRISAGKIDISCQYCDAKVLILKSIEEKYQADKSYKTKQNELKGKAKKRTSMEVEEFRSDSRYYSKEDSPNTVSILHISDLHFGNRDDATRHFALLETDISAELNKNSLDFVVISGDIATHSTEEEYESAFYFVDRLLKRFGTSPERLIIVPGNHDLNWDISKNAYRFNYRSSSMSPDDSNIHIPAGDAGRLERDEEDYKKRFDNFNTFFFKKVFQGKDYPADYDSQAILYPFEKEKILFLGLNTSWQIDNNVQFRNRSSVNPSSIYKCFERNPIENYSNYLKIVVAHHPITGPDAMKDVEFVDYLIVLGFQVYLHGHIHEAIESFHKYDDARKMNITGAGTFGAITKEQKPGIPLQYNLLEIQTNSSKIKVNSRKKEKINGPWSADARWQDKKKPKPFYNIALRSK